MSSIDQGKLESYEEGLDTFRGDVAQEVRKNHIETLQMLKRVVWGGDMYGVGWNSALHTAIKKIMNPSPVDKPRLSKWEKFKLELRRWWYVNNDVEEYVCTDCNHINFRQNNGEITVGFCDKCGHPLWNPIERKMEPFPKAKALIHFPVRYDEQGQMIFDSENHLIVDIAGWGRIQYKDQAVEKMDELGEFIAHCINDHK
jgi:hypothetical protein